MSLMDNLRDNNCLEKLNIMENQLYKLKDLELMKEKGTIPYIINDMIDSFRYISELTTLQEFLVNDWLFDYLEYPDQLMEAILNAKNQMKKILELKKQNIFQTE